MNRQLPQPLALLLAMLSVIHLVGVFGVMPDLGHDFHSFYLSAAQWSQGLNPYVTIGDLPPNLEPPITLLFWRLWTFLPYGVAFPAWTALSVICGITGCVWIARHTDRLWWEAAVLLFAGTPALLGLAEGQPFLLFMLLMTGAWIAARSGASGKAGALIGVLGAIKPFFGLFALWWAWKRDWRALGASALTVVGLHVLGLLIAGPLVFRQWLDALHSISWIAHVYNVSVWGVGARLFTPTNIDLPAAVWTPIAVSPAAVIVPLCLGALVTLAALASLRTADTNRAFIILSLSGILLSPLGWIHYLPIALGPMLAIIDPRRGAVVLGLSLVPHTLLVGQFGMTGTLIVGSWAFLLGMLLFYSTASAATLREPSTSHSARIPARVH